MSDHPSWYRTYPACKAHYGHSGTEAACGRFVVHGFDLGQEPGVWSCKWCLAALAKKQENPHAPSRHDHQASQ